MARTDDTPGVFVDPVFDELYATLTAEGRAGDVAALRVGATIEDLDLRDLAAMRARTTEPDALALHDSLSCGSRNHLRSLVVQLGSRGETYEAVYVSPDELVRSSARRARRAGPDGGQHGGGGCAIPRPWRSASRSGKAWATTS